MAIENKSQECTRILAGSEISLLDIELRDSKKFLQTIIETEPECVKLISADGTLLMMNRAGLDMLQVDSLDQVRGKAVCPLVVSEHREAFNRLTEEVFQGKSGTLTFEMEGVKGRRLWLETHAVPLRNDNNEIIALLGITRDVTERKQTEDALKKERDFSGAVLNTVGSMVLVLDRTGKIVRFNRTCEDISGYAFDEVRGRYVWDFLVPTEQIEDVKKVFSDPIPEMFPSKYENEWVAKDGKRRLISWSNAALLDTAGAVEHVILTGIDITDQRHAEQQLLQEKIFSDTIIDSLPGTFYICDSGGKLIRWNNNEKEVTGYSTEEMSRMNVLDLFREDRPLIVNKMKEVFGKGQGVHGSAARHQERHAHPVPADGLPDDDERKSVHRGRGHRYFGAQKTGRAAPPVPEDGMPGLPGGRDRP